jgi:hypothetical protein
MYDLIASRMIEGGPLYDLRDDRVHPRRGAAQVEAPRSEPRRATISLLDRLGLHHLVPSRHRTEICPATCPAC